MTQSIRILHVEDSEEDRELVERIVDALGHIIVSVPNTERADDALHADPFDLIICDGTLKSKEDGLRWAERQKARGRRIVVLSDGGIADGVVSLSKTRMMSEETYLKDAIKEALLGN